MLIGQERRDGILIGCMAIIHEGLNGGDTSIEDILFAISGLVKLEEMTGEKYIKIGRLV